MTVIQPRATPPFDVEAEIDNGLAKTRGNFGMRADEQKTAVQIMDDMVLKPTLDDFMRRLTPLTEAEYKQLVATLREERPLYIAKEVARKEAKERDEDD